jgi:hypothetical protein
VFCVAYCNKTENLKIKIIKESGTIKSLEWNYAKKIFGCGD